MQDATVARRNMVEGQIRPSGVTHPGLLQAMGEVPREAFLPEALKGVAYTDDDLPLPGGRYVIEPLILARLIQAALPGPGDRALVIGAGVGYGAVILARLVGRVTALEESPDLVAAATRAVAGIGAGNIAIVQGPHEAGWAKAAPYDVILVEGAITDLPPTIAGQLEEGGRLVALWSAAPGLGRGTARLSLKAGGRLSSRTLFDAATPHLPGFARRPAFVFPA